MGRLTTEVFDTANGRPANGLRLHVVRVGDNGRARPVKSALTDEHGRLERPLLEGIDYSPGTYEISFDVGAYFRSVGPSRPGAGLLSEIPVRLSIIDTESSVHLPLMIAPWSCTLSGPG